MRDETLITPLLLRRFIAEAEVDGGDGRHYAIIRKQDGNILVHNPGSPEINPEQLIWASSLLRLLNRELHHDGAWVIVFTHPQPVVVDHVIQDVKHCEYGRYALIWVDADGDPQFTQEWAKGETTDLLTFAHVVMTGIEATAQKAEGSWQIWRTMMRDVLDPREDQLIQRAKASVQ